MPSPGFFSATTDDQSEIAQLQAELQVEKDRHRVLVDLGAGLRASVGSDKFQV
jgi:hypothetical protein